MYKYNNAYLTCLHAFASCAVLVSGLFTELVGIEQSQEWQENQWETLVVSR